jgi:hypothetical protein
MATMRADSTAKSCTCNGGGSTSPENLEEHPPLPGEGIEGRGPRDRMAVPLFADGDAQYVLHDP